MLGWRRRPTGPPQAGVLGVAVAGITLVACAPAASPDAGSRLAQSETPAATAATQGTLLEVRAAGSDGGPGEGTLAADVAAELRDVQGVTRVDAYLFGTAADGTIVVGLDPLDAPLRTPAGAALTAEILGGRTWVEGDEAKPVAYAGRTYADTHKTEFDAILSQMISPNHAPFVDLGGENIVNVRAVVETGSPDGNAQVYVPLAFAQQMFGAPDAVSRLYVTVESADERDAVAEAIRARLGDAVEAIAAD